MVSGEERATVADTSLAVAPHEGPPRRVAVGNPQCEVLEPYSQAEPAVAGTKSSYLGTREAGSTQLEDAPVEPLGA